MSDDPGGTRDRAALDAIWKRVEEAWGDDGTHAAALAFAITTDALPDLAGRYRAAAADPEREPRAKRAIDGIVAAATAELLKTKSAPRPKTSPWMNAAAAVVAVLLIAFLSYAFLRPR